jgi:hypothetical protein
MKLLFFNAKLPTVFRRTLWAGADAADSAAATDDVAAASAAVARSDDDDIARDASSFDELLICKERKQ